MKKPAHSLETLNILKPAVLKLWGGAPWWDINPLQEGCGRPREKYKVKLSFMAIIYACKIINFADAEKVCVWHLNGGMPGKKV